MIRVNIHRAINNLKPSKNATFLEGELYFGRMSKDGNSYVVMSEEGYWIPLEHYTWAKKGNLMKSFKSNSLFYCDNYDSVNYIDMMKNIDK